MKISHTKLSTYETCGKKYEFKYVDCLESPEKSTALIFGKSIDEALNHVLEQKRDKKVLDIRLVYKIFIEKLDELKTSQVNYSKSDVCFDVILQNDLMLLAARTDSNLPSVLSVSEVKKLEYIDWFKSKFPNEFSELGYSSLLGKGLKLIDLYVENILPLFHSVTFVQSSYSVKSGEDELTFVVDFGATMMGDVLAKNLSFPASFKINPAREYFIVFDNKTTGKPYKEDAVRTSKQLALYNDFFGDYDYSGYITLLKKPKKGGIFPTQLIVDKIPEDFVETVFQSFSQGVQAIKSGVFDKNVNSCYDYGRKCEYWDACKNDKFDNLIKRKQST